MSSIPEKEFTPEYYDEQWLGGFFDAEGYLGLRPCVNKHYAIKHTLIPSCQINQAYVAGYFDGEGCIGSTVFQRTHRTTFECEPHGRINSADFDVLNEIHQYLKQKNIDSRMYMMNRRAAHEKPQKQLLIYGIGNVENFLTLIYPFLHSVKKTQAMIMLTQIIPMMKERTHLTKDGFIKLMECVDRLNSTKGGFRRSKYNAEFFRKLWRM